MKGRQGKTHELPLCDHFLVYRSKEDPGRYVAHSLRTDQVGVADTIDEAIYRLLRAVLSLVEEAIADPRLVWEQRAPDEIVERFLKTTTKVPEGIMKMAIHRLQNAKGRWEPYAGFDEDQTEEVEQYFGDLDTSQLKEVACG